MNEMAVMADCTDSGNGNTMMPGQVEVQAEVSMTTVIPRIHNIGRRSLPLCDILNKRIRTYNIKSKIH